MTDLERMWEDLPTTTPPTGAIVSAARRREVLRRRRLQVGGVAAAVGAAFIAGVVVAMPPNSAPPTALKPVAFQADLRPAKSCDELLATYRDRGLELVTAWGWGGGMYAETGLAEDAASSDLTGYAQKRMTEQGSSATGTNVQEEGVDEPDTVKTDGTILVRMRGDRLHVYDITGKQVKQLSELRLAKFESPELLLVGDTVVVMGTDATIDSKGMQRGSRVTTVSIEDPERPKVRESVAYDSYLTSARQHGDTIRLVLSAGLPALDFTMPNGNTLSEAAALAHNRKAVRQSTIEDWLPTYDAGDKKRLLDCDDVAVPPRATGLDTVSIVGFDADAPHKPHAIGLAGATSIAYESADHLYLASSPFWCTTCGRSAGELALASDSGTSHVYDFALDGLDAVHVASGEVEGAIPDRWAMDESDDILRVAVGPSSETGDFNSVVTFKRDGQELVELGRVDNLGPGERLHGMRWFDDLAVVVTFREVDPLFTIDLADPAKPRVLGALKIPGFSDYLHPVSDHQLLGVGVSEEGGAQIALFDVADLTRAEQTDVVRIERSWALAGEDPRTFTWLPEHDTALTALSAEDGRGLLARVGVAGSDLSLTVSTVEYGSDAYRVRTIGLPDGRVVLVTGEKVEFFALR